MHKISYFVILTLAFSVITVGCERSERTATDATASAGSVLPSRLFTAMATEDAISVLDAKSSVAKGDSVVVRGRIGGSAAPFVDGRAMFTIVDASLLACSDTPGDGCKTPWDYCCEPAADIARHAATVRVADADGAPIRVTIKGKGGLNELSSVVVQGVVSQIDGQVMVIDANEISVQQ
jgi:hypothetical protein